MACSNEYNKVDKRDEKMTKYHRSCFELLEQGEGYTLNSNNYWMPWRRNKRTEREHQTKLRIQQ